ncbi:hypothetical protein [Psychrosphaera algicola]|uniref:Phosphoribosylaminoimidazole carboxylase C-terminal domain-containing protein n=1 Tax=Psychrosphaera algicola TaxID=3023714 RepID=A0ABT5FCR9_9GAMM|nr:hypothetical protein [Psychrosphaera sp. G1-22]MDC2888381.1 hypothetical protein [Psychrosphaera sp. G1-22]
MKLPQECIIQVTGHNKVAKVSQFENHIRAVAGLTVTGTTTDKQVAMVNYVGEAKPSKTLQAIENTHLHWYDKSVRAKRKMGHINVVANTVTELQTTLKQVKSQLPESLAKNLAKVVD